MLVRFTSAATESITMFGDHAVPLIKMLGGTGNLPGAVAASDIPLALQLLSSQLTKNAADPATIGEGSAHSDERDREPPIALATRAAPLIEILKKASAADAPVMWESVDSR